MGEKSGTQSMKKADGESLFRKVFCCRGQFWSFSDPFFGKRHVVILLSFIGIFNIYTMRVNLSVAIVAMVANPPVYTLNMEEDVNFTSISPHLIHRDVCERVHQIDKNSTDSGVRRYKFIYWLKWLTFFFLFLSKFALACQTYSPML